MARLYTQPEIAEMFGVTISAVRKWRAQGKLGFIRVNETVRFTQEHLDNFVRDHHYPATAAPSRQPCACSVLLSS